MALITNIEKEIDELEFTINNNGNIKTSLVNGLRRVMISDIPVYNISTHKINFIKNTCIFDNEFIKHRLGLVSVKNNIKDYENILITLSKKNETDEIISVYLSDFKVLHKDKPIKNEDFFKFPKTLITKLKPTQELEVETTVDIGIGRKNSRHTPVSTAVYHFVYNEDERDYKRDKDDYPLQYRFLIESSGQYEPNEILLKSIEVLKNKLNFFKRDIEKDTGKITEFKKSPTKLNAMDIHIKNENDTLGNLLTQYILDNKDVEYSGYHIPHPLKKLLVIRLSYKDSSKETIIKLLVEAINNINKILDDLYSECKKI